MPAPRRGVGLADQAVFGHRREQCLHVLRQRVVATEHQCVRTRRAQQCETRARRESHAHARMLAAAPDQRLHVGQQRVAGMHVEHRAAQRDHPPGIQQRRGLRDQFAAIAAGQQGAFGVFVGIAQRQPQQEAVQLRIGQRVGAGQVDRVLGGDHQERIGQGMGGAVDADLVLGHRLQQARSACAAARG